jgi:hypothetical protein
MRPGERDRAVFLSFLLQAKRRTYAGQGDAAAVTPLVPGSIQLEYREGDYSYRDIYFGMTYFVGQEVVSVGDAAVWSMSYAGGVTFSPADISQARTIYAFLRQALLLCTEAEPYRGPARHTRESLTYTNASHGGLDAFWGVEEILRGGDKVYQLRYAGGFIA